MQCGFFLAECMCKFNETPKSRTSTLFMQVVPVLPFRYGTYTSAATTVRPVTIRTGDPSDQWPVTLFLGHKTLTDRISTNWVRVDVGTSW